MRASEVRTIVTASAATSSSGTVEAAIRFHLGVAVRPPAPSARRIAMRARTARVTLCIAPPPTLPVFVNGVYMPGPLNGVRVLELGQIIAGRMCGVLLLDMGRRQAGGVGA